MHGVMNLTHMTAAEAPRFFRIRGGFLCEALVPLRNAHMPVAQCSRSSAFNARSARLDADSHINQESLQDLGSAA